MTDSRRGSGRAPWTTAAVLGVVAVVLAVVALVVLPGKDKKKDSSSGGGLATSEQQALDAGDKEVVNLLTYTRKTFDADYTRTLAGATGALKSDFGKQKAATLAQMTKGKFDLQGAVTSSAFEQLSGADALILVSAQGYKLPDGGSRTLASTARFEVTMTKVGDKWLASNLQSVGLV